MHYRPRLSAERHALLHVYVNGEPVTVPANIGVTSGIESPLHTHDTSGVIHIEAGHPYPFKLSDLFADQQPPRRPPPATHARWLASGASRRRCRGIPAR